MNVFVIGMLFLDALGEIGKTFLLAKLKIRK